MLLFSTVLSVNESMTRENFLRLIFEWNNTGSKIGNIIPESQWDGGENIRYGDDKIWLEIEEYKDKNIIAVRYEKNEDDGAVWDTDYVMNFNEMKLAVRLDRSYLESASAIDHSFSAPDFISLLIQHGYLKNDFDLPVLNTPIIIEAKNLNILEDLVSGKKRYRLPIVYISSVYWENDRGNVNDIADKLKGVAHVLIPNKPFRQSIFLKIRRDNHNQNESYGAIEIYYPNQAMEHKKFMYRSYEGSDDAIMEKVLRSVIQYNNSQMVDRLYTWQGVSNALWKARYSSQQAEKLAAEHEKEKAVNEADRIMEYADNEIKRLQQQVELLTKANETLTYENQGLRAKLDSSAEVPVIFLGDEVEFFHGEIREMILDALNDKLRNTSEKTRRYDVLTDIIKNNAYEAIRDKRSAKVKNLLRDYKTMSDATRRGLMELGFTITDEGKHYRLIYYGDGRYKTTVSKTASDYREGNNIALTILKNML